MKPAPSTKSIAAKLYLRADHVLLLLNAPEGYEGELGQLPKGAKVIRKSTKPVDAIQLFAATKSEMAKLFQQAVMLLKADGLLWATYPKAGQLNTDLKREVVWECGATVGMHPVSQVAISDVWSALRFKAD